jgi:hypothetical protein
MLPKNSNVYGFESRAINYNARYPVPQKKSAPSKFSPVTSKVRKACVVLVVMKRTTRLWTPYLSACMCCCM